MGLLQILPKKGKGVKRNPRGISDRKGGTLRDYQTMAGHKCHSRKKRNDLDEGPMGEKGGLQRSGGERKESKIDLICFRGRRSGNSRVEDYCDRREGKEVYPTRRPVWREGKKERGITI